jgi:hypothetical protein
VIFCGRMSLAIAVLLTTSCSHYPQEVGGIITENGGPLGSLRVRFLSTGPEGTCEASGPEATTDATGRFLVSQVYSRSIVEEWAAVVVHPYRLCVDRNDVWQLLWHETTGPAPHTLDLRCTIEGTSGRCQASWEKQPFR